MSGNSLLPRGKVVILDLNGTLADGVTATLEIWQDGEGDVPNGGSASHRPLTHLQARVRGRLPPAPLLIEQGQQWQSLYRSLGLLVRLGATPHQQTRGSRLEVLESCQQAAYRLVELLNGWLAAESFRPIRERLLEKLTTSDPSRFILQVEDDRLRRLPWHQWDLLQRYPKAEVALSAPAYERVEASAPGRDRIRILAILGDRRGIDLEADRQFLEQLSQQAETVFLVEPTRQQVQQQLWDSTGWDILFFAGHSTTLEQGSVGQIALNERDRLSLDDLTYSLRRAIAQGLQLAIFNSCDGLGLARQLEQLNLPQLIVFREPVPDWVAQAFLKHFLASLTQGQSLYLAVRDAREQLQSLEQQTPCATWLPILCQNPATPPFTWPTSSPTPRLSPPPTHPLPCPYRGLSAFREADAPFFFGREVLTQELAQAVQQQPFVAVIGPSGSGKSSLVFAGLVPRLRQMGWLMAQFRPGERPFFRIAEALVPLLTSGLSETEQLVEITKLSQALQQNALSIADVIDRVVQRENGDRLLSPTPRPFLLVVDQFEELYGLNQDAEDQQQFQASLVEVVQRLPYVTLVLTLRADFLAQMMAVSTWAEMLRSFPPQLVGAMTRSELRAAIEKPALVLGVQIAEGLTERILEAISRASGKLPLLEFALTLLWEQQQQHCLTHAAYDAIGGVEQALVRQADRVYDGLSAHAQQRTQRLFTQMVQPGDNTPDTRRQATRTELGEEIWSVVAPLADARLVVSHRDEVTGEDSVEIVHEALIHEWQRLRQWLEGDRQFRTWQERLRLAIRQWQLSQQDESALWRGLLLLEAQHWLEQRQSDLSAIEQAFIQQSLVQQQREQTTRQRQRGRVVMGLAGGLIGALFLAGTATWQWQQAERLKDNAQLDAISASVDELLVSGKELEALLESLRAGRQLQRLHQRGIRPAHELEIMASIQQVMYNVREYNRLEGHERTVISASFSSNGQLLATAGDDNVVMVWQSDGQHVATLKGHSDRVRSVSFAPQHRDFPDGPILATGSYDHTVRIWRPDGTLLQTLTTHTQEVNSVSFSPTGRWLASASADGTVKIWQRNANGSFQMIQSLEGGNGWMNTVGFSPDGKLLVAAGSDGMIRLWRQNPVSNQFIPLQSLKGHSRSINSVSVSPTGEWLATASTDGTAKLWQLEPESSGATLRLTTTLEGHTDKIWSVAISAEGLIATASSDQTVRLWQADGTPIATLRGHDAPVYSVIFSPDQQTLVSTSADASVKLWHPFPLKRIVLQEDAKIRGVDFSPDGATLTTVTTDGTVSLWQRDGHRLARWNSQQQDITHVQFSPDGQLLAIAAQDGSVSIWYRTGQLLQRLTSPGTATALLDLSFSPDGRFLVAAGADAVLKIWQRTEKDFQSIPRLLPTGHQGFILALGFSADGQTLATASQDETVRLWRWPTGTLLATLSGHKSDVNSLSFSPDGRLIASGSQDGTVKLWQMDGTLVRTFKGTSSRIMNIAFSPGDYMQTLVSASADGTIKLWRLSGEPLKIFANARMPLSTMSMSPDGEAIALVRTNQTVVLWDLNLDRLMDEGCRWLQHYLANSPDEGDSPGGGTASHHQLCSTSGDE